jgi:capsular polysaccharide transport system permease protein
VSSEARHSDRSGEAVGCEKPGGSRALVLRSLSWLEQSASRLGLRRSIAGKKLEAQSAKPGLPTLTATIAGPSRSYIPDDDVQPSGYGRLILWSFLIFVAIPSLTFLIYKAVFASPQYVSEVKLVVRSADKNEAIMEGLSVFQKLISRNGISSNQDGQIVISYIKSRAILEDIGGKPILSAIYGRDDIDYFSRLKGKQSYEDIQKYWKRHITSSIDTISNILTVRVRAYSSADAYTIAQKILENSEKLINRISERTRKDALDRAAAEVDRAATNLAAQRQALLEFRNRSGSIDPIADVKSTSSLIFALTLQKVELESQMASVAGSIDPGSVIERQRRTQIGTLDKKIEELKATLTNKASVDAISEKLREYEQLRLRGLFAEKIYELSQREYESARKEMSRQQIFVNPIVSPKAPESATYPMVFLESGLFFVVSLMLWGIAMLITASFIDHAE